MAFRRLLATGCWSAPRLASRTRPQSARRQGPGWEPLETRTLLAVDAASPWQNPVNPLDVNANGRVSVGDVLVLVNDLNTRGARKLEASSSNTAQPIAEVGSVGYVDVNGDGHVSVRDVLQVVNALQARDADDLIRFQLRLTDLNGNVITGNLTAGQEFFAEVLVQDLRVGSAATGVLSGYVDLVYNPALVSVSGTNPVEHGSAFSNGRLGSTGTAGLVDELGAFRTDKPASGGADPIRLARVRMIANAGGVAAFSLNQADDGNDSAIFDLDDVVPPINQEFLGTQVTIVGNTLPTLSIATPTAVTEGASQVFTVTLSEPSTSQVTVDFGTVPGTAAGVDFDSQTGKLTFAPGQTTATITVVTLDDALDEADEAYTVELASPVGASILQGVATGTILDNDATPTLSINSVSVVEGNTGTQLLVFTASLNVPSGQTITVNFGTENQSAEAGSDYLSQTGSLTFTPGQVTQTISVPVNGDTTVEANETFRVVLSSPTNATLQTAVGIGTITNDDESAGDQLVRFRAVPANAAGDVLSSVQVGQSFFLDVFVKDLRPGTAGQGVFSAFADITYPAALLDANGAVVYSSLYPNTRTTDLTTDGLVNELGAAAEITASPFGPDEVRLLRIPLIAQQTGVANLTFDPADSPFVDTLLFGSNDTVTPEQTEFVNSAITITAETELPSLSVGDASVLEGNTGTSNLNFTVTLSRAVDQDVTFSVATSNGTATASSDYTAVSSNVTIPAGQTSTVVTVSVNGDVQVEPNETLNLTLTNVMNATLADGVAVGTILNDDQDTSGTGAISGLVFADTNNDGAVTGMEPGIDSVLVRLVGIGSSASFTPREFRTGLDGRFGFVNVPVGTYELRQVQSVFFMDGKDFVSPGSTGAAGNDVISQIVVTAGSNQTGYHFGEWGLKAQFLSKKLLLNTYSRDTWTAERLTQVGTLIAFDEGVQGKVLVRLSNSQTQAVGLQLLDGNGQLIQAANSPFGEVELNLQDTQGAPRVLRITGAAAAQLTVETSQAAVVAAALQHALDEIDG